MFSTRKMVVAGSALLVALAFLLRGAPASAKERPEFWQNPDYDFAALRKIFLLPVSASLTARSPSSVMPASRRLSDLEGWAVSSIQEAMRKKKPIVKTFGALLQDMSFVYGALPFTPENFAAASPEERTDFYKKAADMGFQAMVQIELTQEMEVKHIPERTYTRTVYEEVEVRDEKGRVKESIRIPKEKTEVQPAHDEEYLSTRCLARLYALSDPEGDHVAAVDRSVYREYQGGPVMKVVENVLKASMKQLLGGSK